MSLAAGRRIVLPAEPLRDGPTALRPWRESDADALVELCRDPEVVRWVRVPTPYVLADARAYLVMREETARVGMSAGLAVVDAGTGALLGSVALMRFSWSDRRCEVGYWLGAAGRGSGHATRAVGLICRWGSRALGVERIDCLVATGNGASQRVAQRAGFTREAVLRSYMQGSESRLDMVCFGLLTAELGS